MEKFTFILHLNAVNARKLIETAEAAGLNAPHFMLQQINRAYVQHQKELAGLYAEADRQRSGHLDPFPDDDEIPF